MIWILTYLVFGAVFAAVIEKASRKGDTDYVAFFFLATFWPFVIILFLFFYLTDLLADERGRDDSGDH